MTNTTTEQNKEVLAEQEELRTREKEVAEKIEALLLESKMALQPFMQFSEYGVVPRVRLVDIKEKENDEQGESEGDSEGAGESDGATEPEQS